MKSFTAKFWACALFLFILALGNTMLTNYDISTEKYED